MEFLAPLLQRNVVITLAVIGGLVSVLGSYLVRRPNVIGPRPARFVLRTGYTVTWSSVALFIAAGFWGGE